MGDTEKINIEQAIRELKDYFKLRCDGLETHITSELAHGQRRFEGQDKRIEKLESAVFPASGQTGFDWTKTASIIINPSAQKPPASEEDKAASGLAAVISAIFKAAQGSKRYIAAGFIAGGAIVGIAVKIYEIIKSN